MDSPALYLVTNRLLSPSLEETVYRALAGRPAALQLREKGLSARELYDLSLKLVKACREAGTLFLVNDRVDVALASGADGVHLGSHGLPVGVVRRLLGPDRLVGVSVHSSSEAEAAVVSGADYLIAGHVFDTASKSARGRGTGFIRDIVAAAGGVPVVAIGGIRAAKVGDLAGSGAAAVAVMSAVMGAKDPLAEITRLNRAMAGMFPGLGALQRRPRSNR